MKRKSDLAWDRDLPGFGVRAYATGRIAYVVQSRGPQGSRRATLGKHGDLTPDEARKLAAAVIDRIKAGEKPFPEAPEPEPEHTMAELAQRFLTEYAERQWKPATAARLRQLLHKHILPALGGLVVREVDRESVAAVHHALRGTRGTANDLLWMLSRMFSLAETWGWHLAGTNPCRSVRAYRSNRLERFLSRAEYRKIGRVLKEANSSGAVHPPAVAAIRMLLLTGCRSGEVARLQWDDVDRASGQLRLKDSKTGPRCIPLTTEALTVLDGLERIPGNPWVFTGAGEGSHVKNLTRYWTRLRRKAGLEDVRLHDLRHSYASRALLLGESLSMIGKLLGHSSIDTTARYAHLARDTEKASAAKVAGSIEANILPASVEVPEVAEVSVTGKETVEETGVKTGKTDGFERNIAA